MITSANEQMQNPLPALFFIDDWKIDCHKNLAFNGEREVRLEPKSMMILQYLASQPGTVVTRDTLFTLFWPNQIVTDDALNRVMSNLRRLFNDNSSQPQFIVTIRKVGYKIVAPIKVITTPSPTDAALNTVTHSMSPSTRQDNPRQMRLSGNRIKRYSLVIMLVLALIGLLLVTGAFQLSLSDETHTTEFRRITYDKAANLMPDMSDDGTMILYVSQLEKGQNQLMLRALDNTYATNIGASDMRYFYPSFSNNNHQIAVISKQKQTGEIRLSQISLDQITPKKSLKLGSMSHGLDWHPHHETLVYTQRHIEQNNHGIYLWQPELDKQSLITASITGVDDRFPVFSPDGQHIAFIRRLAPTEHAVFITDLQGNTQQVSAFESEIYSVDWFDADHLLISTREGIVKYDTKGNGLLWQSAQRFSAYYDLRYHQETGLLLFNQKSIQYEGHLVDLTASDLSHSLTASQSSDTEMSISPNGQSFVFVSDRTGQKRLWHRSGNKINPVARTEFDDIYDLNWSPDSMQVVAVIKHNQSYGLMHYALASQTVTVHWQLSSPIHFIGWNSNQTLLFSQLTERPFKRSWQLKQLTLTGSRVVDISNFDMYQARLVDNSQDIVFMNASKRGLWRWNWDQPPEKVLNSSQLSLDRNWDISAEAVWGVNLEGHMFRLDINSGETYIAQQGDTFSHQFRPQKRIYGLAATKPSHVRSDLWFLHRGFSREPTPKPVSIVIADRR